MSLKTWIAVRTSLGPDGANGAASGSPVQDEIMWMPGGVHRITAHRGGRSVTLSVKVDAAAAQAVQRSFEALKAASPQRPYFDHNHDDKAASAWPVEVASTPIAAARALRSRPGLVRI